MPPPSLFPLESLDFDNPQFDLDEIRKVNPQRHEMEQLTAVLTVDRESQSLAGYKDLSDNEFWITGHMPGMAASTKLTWALGSAPKAVDAPENSLASETTWACTSSLITIYHWPVDPSITWLSPTSFPAWHQKSPRFRALPQHVKSFPRRRPCL